MFKHVRQFLGKAYNAAKLFVRPKGIIGAIRDVATDISTQYPPQVRSVLGQFGTQKIVDVKMCKEVVKENTEFLLKALAGPSTWEEAKRKHGFDKFYHLFMIATLENGQQLHIEKNEIMRVSPSPRPCPEGLDLGAPPNGLTVNQMMEQTRKRIGDTSFFTYDPLGNNCQNFVNQLLRSLGLWNETASDFVFQDIKGLREDLPSYTRVLAKGLTDTGAFFNTAFQKVKQFVQNGSQVAPEPLDVN
jgi:hypothetical protein